MISSLLRLLPFRRHDNPDADVPELPSDREIRDAIRAGCIDQFDGCQMTGPSDEFGRWIQTDERWNGTLPDGRVVNFWTWKGRVLRSTLTVGGVDHRRLNDEEPSARQDAAAPIS